uniref:Uncharacterized protein n=1 Tax=Anguilla anguilla TaxID=7936 RepID=A0A0E9U2I4_ANGAN
MARCDIYLQSFMHRNFCFKKMLGTIASINVSFCPTLLLLLCRDFRVYCCKSTENTVMK